MAIASFVAQALSVESNAGKLQSLIDNPAEVTDLTIGGTVDASDLFFISDMMPALRVLDLSRADIQAYSGPRIGNATVWPAQMVPSGVFAGSGISTVILPANGVLKLGDGVFTGSAITSATIGSNISVVPVGTFAGCSKLERITLSGPVVLEANALSDCTALSSVAGSQYITSIGSRAFAGCTALDKFSFGTMLVSIGDEAFVGAGLKTVDLSPASKLESVGDFAFASMPLLVNANLGSVVELGRGVLFGCKALESATHNATTVPDYAFSGNSAILADGLLPDGTESLGRYAMSGAAAISDITLPESLVSLGDHAMEHTTGLKSITVSGTVVPELGSDVWHGIDQSKVNLNVLSGATSDFKNADQWCEFNIVSQSLSIDAVADGVETLLRARFVGDMLEVESSDVDIRELALYDPAGSRLTMVKPDATTVGVDCSSFSNRLYIVYARLADGTVATIKLAR